MANKKFDVVVCRISYSFNTITVDAENIEEAKEIAVDEAGNYIFSEKSSEYEAQDVTEKTN